MICAASSAVIPVLDGYDVALMLSIMTVVTLWFLQPLKKLTGKEK